MMQKLIKGLLILGICMLFGVLLSCNDYLNGVDPIVVDELARLSVQPTKNAETSLVQLPDDLDAGANYGLKALICQEGGYDLYPYAGQTLTRTSVDIEGSCSDLPIKIWVFSTDEEIACAYLAAAQNTDIAPGIWAVNDPHCTFNEPENGCGRAVGALPKGPR